MCIYLVNKNEKRRPFLRQYCLYIYKKFSRLVCGLYMQTLLSIFLFDNRRENRGSVNRLLVCRHLNRGLWN